MKCELLNVSSLFCFYLQTREARYTGDFRVRTYFVSFLVRVCLQEETRTSPREEGLVIIHY